MSVTLRSKAVKRGHSLYLDIYDDGARRREFLKLYVSEDFFSPIRDEQGRPVIDGRSGKPRYPKPAGRDAELMKRAEKLCAERRRQLELGEDYLPRHSDRADFLAFYERVMERDRRKDNASYRGALSRVRDYLTDTKGVDRLPMRELTTKWLEGFSAYLGNHVASSTKLMYLQRLRIVYNVALRENLVRRDPWLQFDMPRRPEAKTPYLTKEEICLLSKGRALAPSQVGYVFLFCCFSGQSVSDIRAFRWSDIRNGSIVMRRSKTDVGYTVPINNTMQALLDEGGSHDEELVFHEFVQMAEPLARKTLKRWWERCGLKRTFKGKRFHLARHSAATQLLAHGVPLHTVGKILGHKKLTTTDRYAKVVDRMREDAMRAIDFGL